MPSYPDSIYSPREKEQRSGVEYIPEKKSVVFVEDVKGLDDEVVAIEDDLKNASRVRAYRAISVQSIPSSEWTKVQLNAENYDDQDEMVIVNPWRFTAKKAGTRSVKTAVYFQNAEADKVYLIAIYKNGAAVAYAQAHSSSTASIAPTLSDDVSFSVGDYLELYVYHNGAAAINLLFGSAYTFMAIHKFPA